jgi:hypothetical protein
MLPLPVLPLPHHWEGIWNNFLEVLVGGVLGKLVGDGVVVVASVVESSPRNRTRDPGSPTS